MTDEPRAGCASEAVREAVRGAVHGALGDGAGAWEVADKAIAAHLAALSAMGRVVVPRESDDAMHEAFCAAREEFQGLVDRRVFPRLMLSHYLWDAMLAASPMEAPPHER